MRDQRSGWRERQRQRGLESLRAKESHGRALNWACGWSGSHFRNITVAAGLENGLKGRETRGRLLRYLFCDTVGLDLERSSVCG